MLAEGRVAAGACLAVGGQRSIDVSLVPAFDAAQTAQTRRVATDWSPSPGVLASLEARGG
jgi:hypothetical protein